MTLVWFLVPTLTATLLMAVFTTLHTTYYYMTIASPAGYLLAALPFASIDWLAKRWTVQPRWGTIIRVSLGAALGLVGLAQLAVSSSHLAGHIGYMQRLPPSQNMLFGPLRWQMALRDIWRTQCIEINDVLPHYWMVSVLETARPVREGTARTNSQSEVWAVGERGGNCTSRTTGHAPMLSTAIRVQPSDHAWVDVYRSLPLSPAGPVFDTDESVGNRTLQSIPGSNVYKMLNGDGPLKVNLNWTLIDLAAPPTAQSGGWITINQAWQVDALPDEPHWNWYFAPFVTLSNETDQALVTLDNAPALEGWMWRPGDIILNTVRLQVPTNAIPGHYKLQITLFDPNQKKNAVFFTPDTPDKPILVLERTLTINAPKP
jgi:hypothetical protein